MGIDFQFAKRILLFFASHQIFLKFFISNSSECIEYFRDQHKAEIQKSYYANMISNADIASVVFRLQHSPILHTICSVPYDVKSARKKWSASPHFCINNGLIIQLSNHFCCSSCHWIHLLCMSVSHFKL